MPEDLRQLVAEYRAFYEVLPYYVLLEDKQAGHPAANRRIQAGFDVDIYGLAPNDEMRLPGDDPGYALGYAEIKKIADEISHHTSDYCALEVITFPSTVILDTRNEGRAEGRIRVRICHYRGLDQPFGAQEEHALADLEKELHKSGVARR